MAEVNKALDRFTETTIDDKVRRHTVALELARLDELQETFYARALEGEVGRCAECTVLAVARLKASEMGIIDTAPGRVMTGGDEWVDQLLAVAFQRQVGSFLVHAHETRVARTTSAATIAVR